MKSTDWTEIMRQLTGRRLAVYDDVLQGRRLALGDLRVQDALGWLVFHRFVWMEEVDEPRARPTLAARDMFLRDGPAKDSAAKLLTTLPGRAGAFEAGNIGMFGVGAPCPDDNAGARPDASPLQAVHASELLPLGDF